MSLLSLKSSHQYWKDFGDPMIYRVVSMMEGVEKWVLDGNPELEKAVDRLSNALENTTSFKVGKEDEFIKLNAYLKMPRLLRALQAIDKLEPGSASKILMFSEEGSKKNATAKLFLRRNIVFERLRLLSRVFSPERFSLILQALENE